VILGECHPAAMASTEQNKVKLTWGSAALGKIACVAFELASCAKNDGDAQLPRMLARHLESRFERVSGPKKLPFSRIWWLQLQLNRKLSFQITFKKLNKNLRLVMAGPLRSPGMIGILCGHRPTSHLTEVSSICREIHASLSSTPGVSAIRWYFKDLRPAKAVATPD
jgi:hypothetical protein